MKAFVINDTRSHYGFVIEVEQNRDGSYYDSVTGLVYEARELQFQWEENPTPVDWKAFRREAAKDMSCAIVHSDISGGDGKEFAENVAKAAIMFADELIRQLKEDK